MCLSLRNTARRGRAAVPPTFARMRWRIRLRVPSRSVCRCIAPPRSLRPGLAGLLPEPLAGVPDPLLLVDVRRTELPDGRRDLADLLAVDPGHGEPGLLVHGDLDPRGDLELDGMREAEVERHRLPGDLRAIADAVDLEVLREPLRHALDGVREERPREPVERALALRVVAPLHEDLALLDRGGDPARERLGQPALRALDLDGPVLERDLHALRHGNRKPADAGHLRSPTRRCRGSRRPRRGGGTTSPSGRPSAWTGS